MKKLLTSLLVILIFSILAVPCLADGFTLEKSNIVDGDRNVPKDIVIELDFSANMVDIGVADFNKECFALLDEEGNTLPIKLVFPDTQIQNAYKKQAFIYPLEELVPGKEYKIAVSKNLMDKNGNKLGRDYLLTFTVSTDETLTAAPNEVLEGLRENTTAYTVENRYEVTTDETTTIPTTQKSEAEEKSSNLLVPISVSVIVVILAASTILLIKKKK